MNLSPSISLAIYGIIANNDPMSMHLISAMLWYLSPSISLAIYGIIANNDPMSMHLISAMLLECQPMGLNTGNKSYHNITRYYT